MNNQAKRILLIDDDLDMHEVVRMILEPRGCRVTCCATGLAGMQALRREPPDVLLLDIMLATPDEGLHLASRIKSDAQLKSVPIIMISAIGQTMGQAYARELGVDGAPVQGFMEKPLSPQKLREAVDHVLPRPA